MHLGEEGAIVKDESRGSGTPINKVGDSLELYVRNLFGKDSLFSYIGNPNNPPDLIIEGGEALEIKKVSGARTDIALNSSPPKAKLRVDDPMLTVGCRECEEGWKVKDMVYVIGTVKDRTDILENIWFVYGDCYAADDEVYRTVKDRLAHGVNLVAGEDRVAKTNEIGRINEVDPLGITYLRVRGMWGIRHPQKVFGHLTSDDHNAFMLIPKEKFLSFGMGKEGLKDVSVEDVDIPSPNNPAKNIDAVLLQKRI